MTAIRTKLPWALVAALGLLLLAALTGIARGGALDPPAAPAPTNRNLVFQPSSCAGFPIVLSQPGSYALASDITMPGGCTFKDGIDITASNVTLDLGGFSVVGLASNSGAGIAAGSSTTGLRLTNGSLSTWSGDGIDFTNAQGSAIDHVTASGSASASGIGLGGTSMLMQCVATANYTGVAVLGAGSAVTDCNLSGNLNTGLFVGVGASGSRITGNHAAANPNGFIVNGSYNQIEDNTLAGTGIGVGFTIGASANVNSVFHNEVSGFLTSFTIPFLSNNDVGPLEKASTATSPWSNITS